MAKTALDLICTPSDASAILKVTEERVLQFCREGRLEARKMGRDWVILTASAVAFARKERQNGVHISPK